MLSGRLQMSPVAHLQMSAGEQPESAVGSLGPLCYLAVSFRFTSA